MLITILLKITIANTAKHSVMHEIFTAENERKEVSQREA